MSAVVGKEELQDQDLDPKVGMIAVNIIGRLGV
jgi:hypothetical protein